jgi:hypothetical protein
MRVLRLRCNAGDQHERLYKNQKGQHKLPFFLASISHFEAAFKSILAVSKSGVPTFPIQYRGPVFVLNISFSLAALSGSRHWFLVSHRSQQRSQNARPYLSQIITGSGYPLKDTGSSQGAQESDPLPEMKGNERGKA